MMYGLVMLGEIAFPGNINSWIQMYLQRFGTIVSMKSEDLIYPQ